MARLSLRPKFAINKKVRKKTTKITASKEITFDLPAVMTTKSNNLVSFYLLLAKMPTQEDYKNKLMKIRFISTEAVYVTMEVILRAIQNI